MSQLFTGSTLGAMELANRLVRSATWEGLAGEAGQVTPPLAAVMGELARGGIGLAITGHAFVSPEGQVVRGQMGIHDDAMLPGLRDLVAAVHAARGRVVVQLAHGGGYANEKLTGRPAVGPAAFDNGYGCAVVPATAADIGRVTAAFAAAAVRARAAGFDAVQLHAAHGYLLSQFLSPHYNTRHDDFGGSLDNRCRFLLGVVDAVHAAAPGLPVLVKLNAEDFVDDGLTVEEMLQVAQRLEAHGAAGIELSGGLFRGSRFSPVRSGRQPPETEVYYEAAARRCKLTVGMPVILVGGIRTFSVAERLVAEGVADAVALCRPLIREPALPRRWAGGDTASSGCTSCGKCGRPALFGNGLVCVADPRYKSACQPVRQ